MITPIFLDIYKFLIDMNRRGWYIPMLIVALNVLAVVVRWSSLPELLPAHFDLQGNASGEISRNVLLLYPLINAIFCLIAYLIARVKQILQTGLIILASGISLIIFSSIMVTLTSGNMPIFMLAEPVILLASIVGFVVCLIKSRQNAG